MRGSGSGLSLLITTVVYSDKKYICTMKDLTLAFLTPAFHAKEEK